MAAGTSRSAVSGSDRRAVQGASRSAHPAISPSRAAVTGREVITGAQYETAAKNGLDDCYLRPVSWRGPEAMGVAAQGTKIHTAVAAWA